MSLTSTISLNSAPSITGTGLLFSHSQSRNFNTPLYSNSGILTTSNIFVNNSLLSDNLTLYTSTPGIESTTNLNSNGEYLTRLNLVVLEDLEISSVAYAQAVVGNLFSTEIPRKSYLNLIATETYQKFLENIYLNGTSQYYSGVGYLESVVVPSSVHVLSGSASDGFGPMIFNESPISGSTYNNPSSSITFELKDQELTSINSVTVQLYINGTQVVNSGLPLSPSGFGLTTFTQVSPSFYLFTFIPSGSFSLGSVITISGEARDTLSPSGNLSLFNYSYMVWDYSGLGATITGLPDASIPYLLNLSPDNLETDVPIDSNIELSILDDHTGVDINTVLISIEGDTVISGGMSVNSNYNITTSSISGGKGITYIIDPDDNFPFAQPIDVYVEAQDLYTPAPNNLVTSYTFITVDNSHLLASGLQIYTGSGYENMAISDTFTSTVTGTDFKIKFYNFDDTGISTTGSFISCNGQVISGVNIISASGLTEYDVFFNLIPDYTTDCDLTFHVQQIPLVSGNTVYKDFQAELLWGMEYCYNPSQNFSYSTEVPLVFMICDLGDTPKLDTFVTQFKTLPNPKNDLYAEITGISIPITTLSGYLSSNNPFFEYGKTISVLLELEDFAGNKLKYPYQFKIESKD